MSWQSERDEYRREVRDATSEARWGVMYFFFKAVLPVFCLITVTAAVGWFVVRPLAVGQRVFDADNIIYNYEWFKETHEQVAAYDVQIKTSKDAVASFEASMGDTPRKDWGFSNNTEHGRLASVVTGLKNQRNNLASQYNARARMATRSIFMSGDVELPQRIELVP